MKNSTIKKNYLIEFENLRKDFIAMDIKGVVDFLNGKITAKELKCDVKTRNQAIDYILEWNLKVRKLSHFRKQYSMSINLPTVDSLFVD